MGANNKAIDNASKKYNVKDFASTELLNEFTSNIRDEFKAIGMGNTDSKPIKQYKSYPAVSVGREFIEINAGVFDVEIVIDIVLRNNYYQDYVFDYTFNISFYSHEIWLENYENFEDDDLLEQLSLYSDIFLIDNIKNYLKKLSEKTTATVKQIEGIFAKYSE